MCLCQLLKIKGIIERKALDSRFSKTLIMTALELWQHSLSLSGFIQLIKDNICALLFLMSYSLTLPSVSPGSLVFRLWQVLNIIFFFFYVYVKILLRVNFSTLCLFVALLVRTDYMKCQKLSWKVISVIKYFNLFLFRFSSIGEY